jgi:hypothetical protein
LESALCKEKRNVQQILDRIRDFVPQLVGALVTLVIGYIVARIVSGVVRGAIQRSGIQKRFGHATGSSAKAASGDVAAIAGTTVFWLIMLMVLLGVFQALNLTLITLPLSQLLAEVFAYIPRLAGAVALGAVAWVLAIVLRSVLRSVLPALHLDQRLGTEGQPGGQSVSRSIADAVFYIVLLLFLPAVLGALGLVGILLPVQHMIDELLAFLPNLLAAGILLLIGWFVARLVGRIVGNLLAAVGLDAASERLGVSSALGGQRLSALIGMLVYILILLPVAISALQTLQLAAVTAPASNMLNLILAELPKLLAAGLTLAIAYVVARVLAPIVTNLLASAGSDRLPKRLGLARGDTTSPTLSMLVGRLVMVTIMLFAAIEALQTIGFSQVAVLVTQFTQLGGHVILGLIVFGIGLFLARLAASAVRAAGPANAGLLAVVAQAAILMLAGAMALQELGIGAQIITLAFGLTLGAVAVAAAIAFGVGGRTVAARELERFVERRDVSGTTREP